jgi:DNA-binding NarL/FixJ family response regulator
VDVWLVEIDAFRRRELSEAFVLLGGTIALTGCFASPVEAIAALEDDDATFDVALIDLGIVEMPGEDLIATFGAARPDAAIVAWANRSDDASIFGALRAGAVGYLLKDSPIGSIARALKSAERGGAPMSPRIARRVVQHFHTDPLASSDFNPSFSDSGMSPASFSLTPREIQVLEVLSVGGSYREVAAHLQITLGTVQSHVKKVYEKLGATSKAEAVRIALESRLVRMRVGAPPQADAASNLATTLVR